MFAISMQHIRTTVIPTILVLIYTYPQTDEYIHTYIHIQTHMYSTYRHTETIKSNKLTKVCSHTHLL